MTKDLRLQENIFYLLDKGIRTYRQFAQKRINELGFDITIDQWLVLNALDENPELPQAQIGEIVFKDSASLTRIIDLLVKKGYLKRSSSKEDRRRFNLVITPAGNQLLTDILEVVKRNRKDALASIDENDIIHTMELLQNLISNCRVSI